MTYQPGTTAYVGFTTLSPSGGGTADADALPTAQLRRNAAIDGAVAVAVTKLSTGTYVAAVPVPSTYAVGDDLEVLVTAVIGTVTYKAFKGSGIVDAAVGSRATPGDVGLTSYLTTPLRSGRVEPVAFTRGATSPDLQDSVIDGTGNPINLTGRTITASLMRLGGTFIFTDRVASLGAWPAGGQVLMQWQVGDLATPARYALLWSAANGASDVLRWSTEVVVE